MNLFANPKITGTFRGNNSASPIAGICTRTAYNRPLKEAKVEADMLIGSAVTVSNNVSGAQTTAINAGTNLAPTTLIAKAATDAADGILVYGSNVVLEEGSTYPSYKANQIGYVALIGSGAEVYLACDNTCIVNNVTNHGLVYDTTNNIVKKGTAGTGLVDLSKCTVLSSVVTGITSTKTGTAVTFKESPVIKIRL